MHDWSLDRGRVQFGKGVVVRDLQKIKIGNHLTIGDHTQLLADVASGSICIGDHVSIGAFTSINADCGGEIRIGSKVLIGPYTLLRASNHKFDDPSRPVRDQGHNKGVIVVEDDVWIAGHVTILPNVNIGIGSVVGAGSVVTSNVPKYTVVAGNPARVIGTRQREK